ncbi:TPA: DNA-binding protein [Escherichia coli]|nr:DNA-binding protein [Escherichia coli]HCJ9023912.1 DNA-binding protein [Escherichia coli]
MSDLMTDSQQQTNSRVFKSPLVSFSTVTGSGRFVSGMKQFRDANPDLCNEVTEQKAWAISPTVVQITEGFNSREMGMGEAYYQLPEVADHLNNIKNAYIRGDYVDPIRVLIKDGIPYVRQGHCRLKAALMAVAEGHSNLTILCIEMKADEISCELTTIDGNRGLALSPVALGESYRRLQALGGWSLDRIAEHEGKSNTTIAALIRLTGCCVYLKKLIHADAISYVAVLSLIDEFGETEAVARIEKMIADLEKADSSGIQIKKTPRGQIRVVPSDFKPARVPPVLATKAVEGVKLITTSLLQKLGDIELPEVTDSSEDEEITFTLNRSMLEMLKNLQSEITESENKQLRRAENRQARLKGEKVTYKTKKNDKNGGEPQSETPPAQA